ncbi:MAG: hypothetical protein KKC58_07305 [Gammaproteobacteria bacterium]|nr:hypothetical protein [Gammaproteobacteria bacterium]
MLRSRREALQSRQGDSAPKALARDNANAVASTVASTVASALRFSGERGYAPEQAWANG